jgi:hypothetical protein
MKAVKALIETRKEAEAEGPEAVLRLQMSTLELGGEDQQENGDEEQDDEDHGGQDKEEH